MKKKALFIVLICIISAVIVFSVYKICEYYFEADQEQDAYDSLVAYVSVDSDTDDSGVVQEVPQEVEMSFKTGFFGDEKYFYDPGLNDYYEILANRNIAALQQDYKDVACWLYIPGTQISYPVMSSEGEYYLRRNFTGEHAKSGALFFMNNLSFDPQNDNIVIYGHNMKSGMMFGSLKAFWLEDGMWNGQNYFYIDLPNGETQYYEMFAIYIENTTEHRIPVSFSSDEEKLEYFNSCKEKSKFPSDETFENDSKIITLSTCTHLENAGTNDRLIIQAKLVK